MDDKVIIQAVKDGDRESFALLMDRYQGRACQICLRMTGDHFTSRELVHDSFVEAYLKIDRLHTPEKFWGWLRQIILNQCRMWFRKNKRVFVGIEENHPEDILQEDKNEDIHLMMAMGLTGLSSSHRLILVLHYFEKFTYEEIADFLEIPPGTVMSRLFRARNELKNRMETIMETSESDYNNHDADAYIKEGIEAEINVLLEMFDTRENSIEPLKVILERSPERLIQFISRTENSDVLENISILINRLNHRSIQNILESCFSDNGRESENARTVMIKAINRCEPYYSKNRDSIASFRAYIILDELIKLDAEDSKKAAFLMDTLSFCTEKNTCSLISSLLICYKDNAFMLLTENFRNTLSYEDSGIQPVVLQSLCRMPGMFLKELNNMLKTDTPCVINLALKGIEAVGSSIRLAESVDYVSDEHILNDIRSGTSAGKWIPVKKSEIDHSVFDDIKYKTAALITHPEKKIREKSIRCLGLLKAVEYTEDVKQCLLHEESSTRTAALLTLADFESEESSDLFIRYASEGTDEEKITAVESIGRLKIKKAIPVLKVISMTAESRLRKAALTALGEMDDDVIKMFLKSLLKSDDTGLKKTVSRVLFGGKKPANKASTQEMQRRNRLRGKKTPFTMNAMDAAIRYAIPEIRKYDERELSGLIAGVCRDFSTARRDLVEAGLLQRYNGVCELTDLGKTVWRVEKFIS